MENPMSEDDELTLPCDQALIACTFALMTAYAQPAADARVDAATQRRLIARKVVSNLFFLREHPQLGDSMRRVVTQVHQHWRLLVEQTEGAGRAADATPARLH
jgi:hypothetical protein